MKRFLSRAGYLLRMTFGGFCAFATLVYVILAITEAELRVVMIVMAAVFGLLAFLLLKGKKRRAKAPAEDIVVLDTVPLVPDAPEIVEPVDAYIEANGMIYRTDGQPISDREVPYLVEMGWRDLVNDPGGVPADATPEERYFLECLEKALIAAGKSPYFRVRRMSTKALSVNSERAYLGKIKLQGKTTWMQYLTGLYDAERVENRPLDEYVQLIKYWVKAA